MSTDNAAAVTCSAAADASGTPEANGYAGTVRSLGKAGTAGTVGTTRVGGEGTAGTAGTTIAVGAADAAGGVCRTDCAAGDGGGDTATDAAGNGVSARPEGAAERVGAGRVTVALGTTLPAASRVATTSTSTVKTLLVAGGARRWNLRWALVMAGRVVCVSRAGGREAAAASSPSSSWVGACRSGLGVRSRYRGMGTGMGESGLAGSIECG